MHIANSKDAGASRKSIGPSPTSIGAAETLLRPLTHILGVQYMTLGYSDYMQCAHSMVSILLAESMWYAIECLLLRARTETLYQLAGTANATKQC